MLDLLTIDGSIITIDAIGCQTKIAEKIISKKVNYVLTVKKNKKTLYNDILQAFNIVDLEHSPYYCDTLSTLEKDNGRIEIRKYDVCYEVGLLEER